MNGSIRNFYLSLVSFALLASCAKSTDSSSSAGIPAIQPPVAKATPVGLKGTSIMSHGNGEVGTMSLSYTELQQRFYGAGPTKIDNLLSAVDTRMADINSRSTQGKHTCLDATAVQYSLSIFGTNQTAYFQCYDIMSDGTGGVLFGKKDNVWYLYQNIGAGHSFAVVTPVASSSGDYVVEAWFSVGIGNTPNWYSGSYGVIHLKADSSTKNLEMAVAGTGFGYCGAQLKTDGTNLFVKGSSGGGTSDGSTWTCQAADTVCKLASDLTQAGTCSSIDNTTFQLTALGTTSSTYGSGTILDGTSTDDIHFGPSVTAMSAISGVASF
ncbi:MAG: hypothetical protein ACXVCY_05885 [Pseudobdellovibrionaceae bacterium]